MSVPSLMGKTVACVAAATVAVSLSYFTDLLYWCDFKMGYFSLTVVQPSYISMQ